MTMTMQDLEAAIKGEIVFTRGKDGPVIPYKLSPAEKVLYQKFTAQGFAVQKGRPNAFAAFSAWCNINKKPQIFILDKAKYSHVELDMILTDRQLSEAAVELVRQALDRYIIYRNPKFPTDDMQVGAVYSYSNRIPKEKAEEAAKELATIANNPENWKTQ